MRLFPSGLTSRFEKATWCLQEVQSECVFFLCTLLGRLTTYTIMGSEDGAAPSTSSAAEGVPVYEAWLSPSFADLDPSVHPPRWHIPSAEEVSTQGCGCLAPCLLGQICIT